MSMVDDDADVNIVNVHNINIVDVNVRSCRKC